VRSDAETQRLVAAREHGAPWRKWEYPWYAAWDLAFHTVALSIVDLDFAKHQLELMLRDVYQHPNGQLPAYEWNFGDVNPPVHAWAALYIYHEEKLRSGTGDLRFLRSAFHGLVPRWRDQILFYEYFHGDNGAGIGASHQTGWTGLVAKLLQLFGTIAPETVLSRGARAASGLPAPPG
jgi:hypothetical protein